MILAATFTALGFIGWLVGMLLEMPGVAMLGAILVVGVGGMVMSDGLQVRDGQIERNVSADETEIEYTYSDFQPMDRWPVGELWLIFGGILTLRSLSGVSES
ncbi:hypothetical protein [Natronomonas halophila]|uniref:hypothetical protein n=1 Tax=Natronomonas halophila TaxID=2747817 RepID=UPI001BABA217|nr:hypothetical protein [Natronomonas halophila]